MFFVLSPTKNLNEGDSAPVGRLTRPDFSVESEIPMETLHSLVPQQITELMHVSDKIVLLNAEYNATWHTPFTSDNAKQAVFIFDGNVYRGLDAVSLTPEQADHLQQRVRLLPGPYGVSRPLDLMQPCWLEMGTLLANPHGRNFCEFWGGRITSLLDGVPAQASASVLVNLASQEYFKLADARKLDVRLATPVFKDEENGKYKIISFYAKRARGLMVCYAAEHDIANPEQLEGSGCEDYRSNEAASDMNEWIFLCEE